jgi:hypothetical protein
MCHPSASKIDMTLTQSAAPPVGGEAFLVPLVALGMRVLLEKECDFHSGCELLLCAVDE